MLQKEGLTARPTGPTLPTILAAQMSQDWEVWLLKGLSCPSEQVTIDAHF